MPQPHIAILNSPVVRAALRDAWADSTAGTSLGREEGGFVIQDAGNLDVVRWPEGERDSISVPPHPDCKIDNRRIVATFHTHPNAGDDYLQEPSETDKRAVRDDPDLKDAGYVGKFVVSHEIIFLITPSGRVREVAETGELFSTV